MGRGHVEGEGWGWDKTFIEINVEEGSDENLSAFIYLHSIRLPFMQTFICMYIYIFSMYIRIALTVHVL